jgi:hypothetical protein
MFLFAAEGSWWLKWRSPLQRKRRSDNLLFDSHYLQPKEEENKLHLKGFLNSSIYFNILILQIRLYTKLILENISGIHTREHLPDFIEYNRIFVGSLLYVSSYKILRNIQSFKTEISPCK